MNGPHRLSATLVRLPPDVKHWLVMTAHAEGVSLNGLLVTFITAIRDLAIKDMLISHSLTVAVPKSVAVVEVTPPGPGPGQLRTNTPYGSAWVNGETHDVC